MEYYYKVVRSSGNGKIFLSATGMGEVTEYTLGEKTNRPKLCGPLAVFSFLVYARNFCKKLSVENLVIFRCKITGSLDTKLWVKSPVCKISVSFCDMPEGTVFADSVTLLEQIK